MSKTDKSKKPAGEEEEICPVCKSSRYLNPQMQFRINPECYHKMCSSCIDRIFSSGPALCPIAGCGKTLRKAKFRPQTFSDIVVEREVDIRKKLAAVFNRREDEFESPRAYNQYLEDVETMTFDVLAGGPEAEATWAKIRAYENSNAETIAINAELAAAELLSAEARQAALKEAAKRRREMARKQEEAERVEREEARTEIIDQLASGKDPVKLTQRVKLQRSSAARKPATSSAAAGSSNDGAPRAESGAAFTISGLRAPAIERVQELEKPYSPFSGGRPTFQYHALQSTYENPYLDKAKTTNYIIAGGYDIHDYYRRTMCEAFAGLGVFVEQKKG